MAQSASTTRILIGGNSPPFLESLARYIGEHNGFDLVGVAPDEKIMTALASLEPDIALLGPFGPEHVQEPEILSYARERVRVVFVSAQPEPTLYDAIALGAMGYLTLAVTRKEIFEILEAVALGRGCFSRDVQDALRREIRERNRTVRPVLTRQEQEVLRLMGQGLNSAEIGRRLHITKSTVKTHQNKIYKKLDVHSGGHAVVVAARHRLI